MLSLAAAASSSTETALDAWVCLNGADPATESALDSMPRTSALKLRVVRLQDPLTPGAARNRLLDEFSATGAATPDWVFFLDDDAYVDPAYLTRFLEARAAAPHAAALGGPNLTPPRAPFFSRATGVALSSKMATYFSSARYRAIGVARETNEEELSLCNLLMRADALGDERFPAHLFFGEESWLLSRLRARGLALVYDPRLALLHDRRRTPTALARQVARYGAGRARNLARDSSRLRWAHAMPSLCMLATAGVVPAIALGAPGAPVAFGWITLAAAYLLACAMAAARAAHRSGESAAAGALAIAVIPLIHVCYGIGFLWGWVRRSS